MLRSFDHIPLWADTGYYFRYCPIIVEDFPHCVPSPVEIDNNFEKNSTIKYVINQQTKITNNSVPNLIN